MLQSMTGFARSTYWDHDLELHWEIRSVNSRYLEVNLSIPSALKPFEAQLKAQVNSFVGRGKIDAILTLKQSPRINTELDTERVQELFDLKNKLDNLSSLALQPLSWTDILGWPGVIKSPDLSQGVTVELLVRSFNQALADLQTMRQIEGAKIAAVLLERFKVLTDNLNAIKVILQHEYAKLPERLGSQLKELQLDVDSEQKALVLVSILQKMDVVEECDRLMMHLSQVNVILNSEESVVGRRIDFIVQEILRETNTLGAKAANIKITDLVISMKVLIEQVREQVQNLE